MTGRDLELQLNKASGTSDGTDAGLAAVALNWTTDLDFGDGFRQILDPGKEFSEPLPNEPGSDQTKLALTFEQERLRIRGSVEIDLFGFFSVSGDFAFERRAETVTLSDGTSLPVDLMTVGASNVNAFAESTVRHEPEAMGLSLTNADFALAMISPRVVQNGGTQPANITDLRRWTALKASADNVAIIGIDDFSLAGSLVVELNQGTGTLDGQPNTTVVDFGKTFTDGLVVDTGADSETSLDYENRLLRVSAAPVNVTVFGMTLSGDFFFEKATAATGEEIMVIAANNIGVDQFSASGDRAENDASGGNDVLDIRGARGNLVVIRPPPTTDDATKGQCGRSGRSCGGVGIHGRSQLRQLRQRCDFEARVQQLTRQVSVNGAFGSLQYDAGPFRRLAISDLKIEFPGVELNGSFSVQSVTHNGQRFDILTADNVRVFVGDNTNDELVGLETDGRSAQFSYVRAVQRPRWASSADRSSLGESIKSRYEPTWFSASMS